MQTVLDEKGRLICQCCGLPFARLQNGCLVVESRHSGEKHVNAVSIEELVKLAKQESVA